MDNPGDIIYKWRFYWVLVAIEPARMGFDLTNKNGGIMGYNRDIMGYNGTYASGNQSRGKITNSRT
jgi:hypothetical protein